MIAKWRIGAFFLEAALTIAVIGIGWRIIHVSKASPEYERLAWTRLAFVDRGGVIGESFDLAGRYCSPRLSLDRATVFLTRLQLGERSTWALDLSNHKMMRLGSRRDGMLFELPSVDGRAVVFVADDRRDRLFVAANREPARRVFTANWMNLIPVDWSHDGRWIAVARADLDRTALWITRNDGAEASLILDSHFESPDARFSPDGKRIALTSNLTGRDEVYVATVGTQGDQGSDLIRISPSGGHSPQWGSSDELFYLDGENRLVDVTGSSSGRRGQQKLFAFSTIGGPNYEYAFDGYAPDRDGGRLLILLRRIFNKHAALSPNRQCP